MRAAKPPDGQLEMKNRKTFILYSNYAEKFADLTDEQMGKLFKAILAYQNDESVEFTDPLLKLAWRVVSLDLKANDEKYEAICQRRSEAGKKGGRPQDKEKQMLLEKANALEPKQTKAKKANAFLEKQKKLNDNENENENDIISLDKSKLAKATGEQTELLPVENLPTSQKKSPVIKKKEDKRNPHVEQLMTWFAKTYGFPPTDKKPRQRAYNIVQKITQFCKDEKYDPTPERIGLALGNFAAWYASFEYHDGTQTMDAVARKFDVWKATLQGKRRV